MSILPYFWWQQKPHKLRWLEIPKKSKGKKCLFSLLFLPVSSLKFRHCLLNLKFFFGSDYFFRNICLEKYVEIRNSNLPSFVWSPPSFVLSIPFVCSVFRLSKKKHTHNWRWTVISSPPKIRQDWHHGQLLKTSFLI